jgi:hypothetical protein
MNYEKYSEVIIPPEADLKLPINNNSRYFYNNKIKELVLDIKFTDTKTFDLKLAEPLIIDSEHDIFLDVAITNDFKNNTDIENKAFLLEIDQFNIQTKSATNIIIPEDSSGEAVIPEKINNKINRKILIPNEGEGSNVVAVHKGTKFNYIGTITPCKLMNITGIITDIGILSGGNLNTIEYNVPFDVVGTNPRIIIEFKLVPRE